MKTNLQLLQSRISKRRNYIRTINSEIEILVVWKNTTGVSPSENEALKAHRMAARMLGVDQRLDKQLFQMLLAQERNKHAEHFRSKYPHWLSSSDHLYQRVA